MVTIELPFFAQLIISIAVTFALCKLLLLIRNTVNDPRFWVKEAEFRMDVIEGFRRGLGVPLDLTNNWYFTEILAVLAYILAVQQGILVFGLLEMLRWYDILEKIAMFHESNPDLPRPNISPEMLDEFFSPSAYIYYTGIVLAFGGVLIATESKIEAWREGEGSILSTIRTIIFVMLSLHFMITIAYNLISSCSVGENVLKDTLST